MHSAARRLLEGEVGYDDGSVDRVLATRSRTTGDHWIVWCLDVPAVPTHVTFFDEDGALLDRQQVRDPRDRGPLPKSRRPGRHLTL